MPHRPLLLALPVLLLTLPALADPPKRQAERRIEQGAESGALTPAEQQRLEKQRKAVSEMKQRANADGIVTDQERKAILKAERRLSNHIYNQKHDRQGKNLKGTHTRGKKGKSKLVDPRVKDGVRDGSLTQKEARHLNRRANKVDNLKDRATSDAYLTDKEQKRIHRAEKGLERDIKRKKNNKRKGKGKKRR